VLGAGVLWLVVFSYWAQISVQEQQVADTAARIATEQRERAAKKVSAAASAAAAETAKTPEQLAKEARAAAQTRQAEAKEREARARLNAKIDAMEWWNQCKAWGREVRSKKRTPWRDALGERLTSERMLNVQDRMYVADRVPSVGMTTCGVIAQIGLPDAANTTTTASSTTVQMAYRGRGVYVYTRAAPNEVNGIVNTVQD
jgi:hypothetical protein